MKAKAEQPGKPRRLDRVGRRLLGMHLDEGAFREVKVLAARKGVTTDVLLNKALALLFRNYGRRPPRAVTRKLDGLDL
jgi:hypothetical protein